MKTEDVTHDVQILCNLVEELKDGLLYVAADPRTRLKGDPYKGDLCSCGVCNARKVLVQCFPGQYESFRLKDDQDVQKKTNRKS